MRWGKAMPMNQSEEMELWWNLSYAAWLTLPRVLVQEMPPEWQDRLAALLHEYSEAFPCGPRVFQGGTRVQITDERGNLVATPEWLKDYRHPDERMIAKARCVPQTQAGDAIGELRRNDADDAK